VAGVWLAGGTQSEILRHVTQRKILKNNNKEIRNNTTRRHNASEPKTTPQSFDDADLGASSTGSSSTDPLDTISLEG
jgi:hypothetical protein